MSNEPWKKKKRSLHCSIDTHHSPIQEARGYKNVLITGYASHAATDIHLLPSALACATQTWSIFYDQPPPPCRVVSSLRIFRDRNVTLRCRGEVIIIDFGLRQFQPVINAQRLGYHLLLRNSYLACRAFLVLRFFSFSRRDGGNGDWIYERQRSR